MTQLTSFDEVNGYLNTYTNNYSFYNLENIRTLMDYLGHPECKYKTVHIAGTSGKTSTAYFMSSLLVASGKKVGLTVSPVVDEVNERVQINQHPLTEQEYVYMFNKLINLLSNIDINFSRFELLVTFAYWYFAEQQVDYAVIEVGLGGLNDATNVIHEPNKVCLITDIGYDHMDTLGHTLSEIARHKAGIIYNENHVFMYKQSEEIMQSIKNRVEEVDASLCLVSETQNMDKDIADYQHRNWQLAYAAYGYIKGRDALPELSEDVLSLTKHVQVPARMDVKKYNDKTIILDGAHNPQKMSTFISSFKRLYPNEHPVILVALGPHKDYVAIAAQLSNLASKVIVTNFMVAHSDRHVSLSPKKIAAAISGVEVAIIDNANEAFNDLLRSPTDILVITGSIYLISQLRREVNFLK